MPQAGPAFPPEHGFYCGGLNEQKRVLQAQYAKAMQGPQGNTMTTYSDFSVMGRVLSVVGLGFAAFRVRRTSGSNAGLSDFIFKV